MNSLETLLEKQLLASSVLPEKAAALLSKAMFLRWKATKEDKYLRRALSLAQTVYTGPSSLSQSAGALAAQTLYALSASGEVQEKTFDGKACYHSIARDMSQKPRPDRADNPLYAALPFYIEWNTRFDLRTGYRDIYLLLLHGAQTAQQAPLPAAAEFVQLLSETLEHMDEQIYYEYRDLAGRLKGLLDLLLPITSSMESPETLYSASLLADAIWRLADTGLLPERFLDAADAVLHRGLSYFSENSDHVEPSACAALYLACAERAEKKPLL